MPLDLPTQPCPRPSVARAALQAALLAGTACLLVACGGGGGGGSAPPPPPPAPTPVNGAGTVTVTPLNAATGVKRDANVVATATVTAGTLATLTLQSFVCDGTAVVNDAVLAGSTLTVTPKATSLMPYGTSCKATGQATISGTNGGSQSTVSWETTFAIEGVKCTSPQEYSAAAGACTYSPGVSISGSSLKQLPASCTSVKQQCWTDFVKNGNAVWIKTPAMMVGAPSDFANRPIIFAAFIGSTGKEQVLMFFADTMTLMNSAADIDVQWNGEGFEWLIGSDSGYIAKSRGSGVCYQWHWNPPTGHPQHIPGGTGSAWDNEYVSCKHLKSAFPLGSRAVQGTNVGPPQSLPDNCNESCWQAAIIDGTVQVVDATPVDFITGWSTTMAFALYKTTDGYHHLLPVEKLTGSRPFPDLYSKLWYAYSQPIEWARGVPGNVIYKFVGAASCETFAKNPDGTGAAIRVTTACPS